MLSGPTREPASGKAKALVILLHGYGADGDDLIGLADAWAPALPGAAFVAPHAPQVLPYAGAQGRQWFDLTMRDPGEYWRGVSAAGPELDRFLDHELERHGVSPDRLALVGFSQGTMLALHVGLRRSRIAGIAGYSGLLAGPEHLAADMRSRPPVLLVHGAADDVVPVQATEVARDALAQNGVPVEWHIVPGLGHGIDETGLRAGQDFLSRVVQDR